MTPEEQEAAVAEYGRRTGAEIALRRGLTERARNALKGKTALSVRVICPIEGCEVGRVVETELGPPVWKPCDAQFDADLAGGNPFRNRDDGVVIIRTEPLVPTPLDDLNVVRELVDPAEEPCVVGACRHGIAYASVAELMRERSVALANHSAGKMTARRPDPR